MKDVRCLAIFGLAALFIAAASGSQAADDGEWEALFNGKNLKGWEQLGGKAKFEVEDGVIVGTTVPGEPNSFLCTKETYSDFALQLDFKVDADLNSGVQFRSLSKKDYKDGAVHGYQVDIDPQGGIVGGIYDELRSGWLDNLENAPLAKQQYRPDDWNHFRIEAVGDSLKTWVNDVPAADVTDSQTAEGFIALQVHEADSEQPLQVRFKNIRIQEIKDAGKKPSGDLVPLEIELPRPLFIGTPQNIRAPNLERPTGKPRPPFLAPKGVETISLMSDVTASDPEPIIGDHELITDGDKEGTDGSFVEYGPGVQWVQIDLGDTYEIYAIVLWHYHSQARVYHDVVVRSADDQDFISNVQTLYNNDHDNSAGLGIGKDKAYIETSEGRLIDTKGVKARYLRFYSNGSTSNKMNHYIEAEVFGKPAK